ncbi:hypothetical protein C0J52_21929 [Blattella germanica]|nr:hypothetical protein C0J52_21929 [Blattella germanica]
MASTWRKKVTIGVLLILLPAVFAELGTAGAVEELDQGRLKTNLEFHAGFKKRHHHIRLHVYRTCLSGASTLQCSIFLIGY